MAGNKKLLGVQYLRAIAALMIAYFHLVGIEPTLAFKGTLDSSRLPSGVWIFFVISGFIMYVTARKLSPGEFVWRRIVRIVPLYWALTLAICVIAIVAPSALHRTQVTVGAVVSSLLFIPYHNPTQGGVLFPVLVPGWTLDYEMAFYGLFALALMARRHCAFVAVGALCVLAAAGMVHSRPQMTTFFGFYFNSRLLLFASGILIAVTYERLRVPRIICALLTLAGFWLLLASWQGEAASQAADFFGATSIVLGAVAWERQFGLPEWRALLLLGDASYSIYLAHTFAFRIIGEVWRHPRPQGAVGATLFGVVSMAAAIGLALITYRLIERPTLEFLTRNDRVGQPKILQRPA
jgi:exopolysaccharide production protein ExoZ